MELKFFVFFTIFVLGVLGLLFLLDRFLYRQLATRFPKFQRSWMGKAFSVGMFVMPIVFLSVFLLRRWITQPSPLLFGLTLLLAFWYLPKLPLAVGWSLIAVWQRRIRKPKNKNFSPQRRQMVMGTLAVAVGYPYVIAGVGAVETTYKLQVVRKQLGFANLPPAFAPLRIVQLSDFHTGSFLHPRKFFRRVLEIVASLRPDLVVITGDWVNFDPEELEPIAPLLRMRLPYGVFGCLGNHDHYMSVEEHHRLQEVIRDSGVQLLVNAAVVLERRGEKLAIVGTDNTGTGQRFGDLGKAMAAVPEGTFTLLLAHTPSYWDKAVRGKAPVELMLSGHTHGGQLALPMGALTLNPAHLVFRYVQGLYTDPNGQKLYVNAGLGTTFFPLRTGVPPEITLLELWKQEGGHTRSG